MGLLRKWRFQFDFFLTRLLVTLLQGGDRDLRNGGPAKQALPAERATAREAGKIMKNEK